MVESKGFLTGIRSQAVVELVCAGSVQAIGSTSRGRACVMVTVETQAETQDSLGLGLEPAHHHFCITACLRQVMWTNQVKIGNLPGSQREGNVKLHVKRCGYKEYELGQENDL